MKQCSGCSHEYDEQFNFCPMCGKSFNSTGEDRQSELNRHLASLKRAASTEAMLTKRVSSGQGLGDAKIGRVFGADTDL